MSTEDAKLDPLRHHEHYHDDSPYAGGSSFMERMSEKVASGMGTVPFIIVSSAIILGWVFANGAAHYISQTITNLSNGKQYDPEPWILLNLVFSGVAFYTGALVIIAQKAQTRTDKANEEAAAKHRDELSTYQNDLLKKNTDLTEQIHTLTEKLNTLTEEVHRATCLGARPPAGRSRGARARTVSPANDGLSKAAGLLDCGLPGRGHRLEVHRGPAAAGLHAVHQHVRVRRRRAARQRGDLRQHRRPLRDHRGVPALLLLRRGPRPPGRAGASRDRLPADRNDDRPPPSSPRSPARSRSCCSPTATRRRS